MAKGATRRCDSGIGVTWWTQAWPERPMRAWNAPERGGGTPVAHSDSAGAPVPHATWRARMHLSVIGAVLSHKMGHELDGLVRYDTGTDDSVNGVLVRDVWDQCDAGSCLGRLTTCALLG